MERVLGDTQSTDCTGREYRTVHRCCVGGYPGHSSYWGTPDLRMVKLVAAYARSVTSVHSIISEVTTGHA
eukprot:3305577-Rhodomonas_salina.5